MGIYDRHWSRNFLDKFQKNVFYQQETIRKVFETRIQLISKIRTLLSPKFFRISKISIFFIVSWMGAEFAIESSERRIITEWLAKHKPTKETWVMALSPFNLRQITDQKKIGNIMRSVRLSFDEQPGSVWFDASLTWVIVYQSENETLFFEKINSPKLTKASWNRTRPGWEGIEVLMIELRKQGLPQLNTVKQIRDLRQLIF